MCQLRQFKLKLFPSKKHKAMRHLSKAALTHLRAGPCHLGRQNRPNEVGLKPAENGMREGASERRRRD